MCLIIFDWAPQTDKPLRLLSNRDEFHARPSQSAHNWQDEPHIYGGRDLEKQGTWLGISSRGRMACVTNYREKNPREMPHSRGEIVRNFLNSSHTGLVFANNLNSVQAKFPGFNALLFDGEQMIYSSNRSPDNFITLPPGIYGVSNHLLDTPWPKLVRAKRAFKAELSKSQTSSNYDDMFRIMLDQNKAKREELPQTGVPEDVELLLSSIFIRSPTYGTRTTTYLELTKEGVFNMEERHHTPSTEEASGTHAQINIKSA